MRTLNIHEAKTRLSAILADVEKTGEAFLICRNGKPIAELIPHKKRDRLAPHPVMSGIDIRYDPVEPLDPDDWPEDV